MKRFISLALAAALLALPSASAFAHGFKAGNLEIHHPNSTEMLPGAPVGDGFLTITNNGKEADRLLKVTSPATSDVQLHEMKMDGDVMKMRALPDGIEIPAGATVSLKKSGLHVMFMHPEPPFRQGDMVKATLVFEKAGPVDVEFMIEAQDTAGGEHKDHKN